jgi:hypothetical protein
MATANGFVDRKAELEFVLTKMDGKARCEMLGIEERHYETKEAADAWYNSLVTEAAQCTPAAQACLKGLHDVMTHGFE